jgi:hypothetical protein
MDGVETPKDRRIQRGSGFEQRIIESDQVQPLKESPRSCRGGGPLWTYGAQDFDARECT